MSLVKNQTFERDTRLQIRLEVFNVLKSRELRDADPGGVRRASQNERAGDGRQVTRTVNPSRQVQLGSRSCSDFDVNLVARARLHEAIRARTRSGPLTSPRETS